MKGFFKTSLQGVIGGPVVLAAGIFLLVCYGLAPLSWTMIGLGFLSFFSGLMGVISSRQVKQNAAPMEFKIAIKDERTAVINDKVKIAVHDFSAWAMWPVIVVLAVMQVELWILMVLLGVHMTRLVVGIIARLWLQKTM